jgi:hypothetical protein
VKQKVHLFAKFILKEISSFKHSRFAAYSRNSVLCQSRTPNAHQKFGTSSLFGWLVADGWCWFVLREEYCWLVAGGWFVVREKYCWLMADKPSEQGAGVLCHTRV